MANPIITENQNTGSTGWKLTNPIATQICGYVDKCSYSVGDTLTLFVSTQSAGTGFSILFYRLGWYGGTGGRLMQTVSGQTGVAQGFYDGVSLQNCPTAVQDGTTLLLEARWASSYTLVIPGGWVTGMYLILLQDANGKQSYVPFVLKGNTSADYVIVMDDTTTCAYNAWGGHSLYTYNSLSSTAATKVSFDRPIYQNYGGGNLTNFDIPLIKWLERQGYNLSYISGIDLHSNAAQLKTYKAYISLCHDEYWTKEMRDGVEAAIVAGVSCAFMGADASYWQARLETGNGGANRTLTCYKVSTSPNTLATDPFYGVDTTRVTSKWRDAVLNRPENSMIGIMYSNVILSNLDVAWTTDASMDTTYNVGTGLLASTSYGYDLVGYEYDKIQSGSPAGLKTIATTSLTNTNSQADTSNTTFYKASSGALVFATGSVGWVGCLDTYRYSVQSGGTPAEIPAMQILMANIMGALKGPVFSMIGV